MKKLAIPISFVLLIWSCNPDISLIEPESDITYFSIENTPELQELKNHLEILQTDASTRSTQDLFAYLDWKKVRIKEHEDGGMTYGLNYLTGSDKLTNVWIIKKNDQLNAYQATIHSPTLDPKKEYLTREDLEDSYLELTDLFTGNSWISSESSDNADNGRMEFCWEESYFVETWTVVETPYSIVMTINEPQLYTVVKCVDDGTGAPSGDDSGGGGDGDGDGNSMPTIPNLCPEGSIWIENDCYPVCSEEAMDAYAEICEEIPCDDDPLIEMEISPWNQSKNSNRFGCVRVDSLKTCENVSGKRMHAGIDLKADIGTNIYSIKSGTVFSKSYGGGWGNYIIIKSNDLYFLYAHLRETPEISGSVSKGQFIGVSGESQTVGEPHLHLEVRKQTSNESYNNMQKVDIENYLGSNFDSNGEKTDGNCL